MAPSQFGSDLRFSLADDSAVSVLTFVVCTLPSLSCDVDTAQSAYEAHLHI